MAKTPSKRGSGRGKTGTGSGKPATKPDDTRKDTGRKAAGKKAGGKKLPGWMPDAPRAGKPSRRDKPAAGKPGAGSTGGVHDPHEIGRAHVRTPVTNAHLVWRFRLEKTNEECTRHSKHQARHQKPGS